MRSRGGKSLADEALINYTQQWIEDFDKNTTGTTYQWTQKLADEFSRIPTETLIRDPYFLGFGDKVFDGVLEDIVALFNEKKKREVNLALFLEGIGAGKTTKASIIMWLLWYELSMIPNPQNYYDLAPDSVIAIINMNRTERQAKKVTFTEVFNRFQSPFNKDYFPINPRYTTEVRISRNNTTIFPGTSSSLSALGYNLYCISHNQKIHTPNGIKRSGDLIGQGSVEIIGFDKDTQDFTLTEAAAVVDSGVKEVFEVTFEDGSIVECTEDHQFLCWKLKRGNKRNGVRGDAQLIFEYKKLKDITSDDEILSDKDFIQCPLCNMPLTQLTHSHFKRPDQLLKFNIFSHLYKIMLIRKKQIKDLFSILEYLSENCIKKITG